MRDQLDRLIEEMVEKGITYADAHREFERRYIATGLGWSNGSLSRTAARLGIHRNTLSRKITAYRLKRRSG